MNLQPTLPGKLLRLRPLKADDFEQLFESASDPLIWEQHPQPTRYQREVFQKYFDSGMESKGALVAIDSETNIVIGSSRYYNLDLEKRHVTVGYTFLARKYWGGSYNREMKKLMLDHAFEFVETVYFEIGASNLRSIKAIEKIGAQFVRKEGLDGRAHVVFKISRS